MQRRQKTTTVPLEEANSVAKASLDDTRVGRSEDDERQTWTNGVEGRKTTILLLPRPLSSRDYSRAARGVAGELTIASTLNEGDEVRCCVVLCLQPSTCSLPPYKHPHSLEQQCSPPYPSHQPLRRTRTNPRLHRLVPPLLTSTRSSPCPLPPFLTLLSSSYYPPPCPPPPTRTRSATKRNPSPACPRSSTRLRRSSPPSQDSSTRCVLFSCAPHPPLLSIVADLILPPRLPHFQLRQQAVRINPSQNSETLQLQLTVKALSGVVQDEKALAREEQIFSKQLYTWSKEQGEKGADIVDIGDRLAFLVFKRSELELEAAAKIEQSRSLLKDIVRFLLLPSCPSDVLSVAAAQRNMENGLVPRRRNAVALANKIATLRKENKKNSEEQMNTLSAELSQLENENSTFEASFSYAASALFDFRLLS